MGVVVVCSTARLRVSCRGVGGCVGGVRWFGRHGSHGKVEEKAMRSMGPPHAYVCDLLIKLLHYQIFLESPCPYLSKCYELSSQGFVYILVVPF